MIDFKKKLEEKTRDNGVGYISASRESSYNKCRFSFWNQVIVNKNDQYSDDHADEFSDAVYLLFGKAMHKTLELFHKDKHRKRAEMKELFRQAYIDFGVDNADYYFVGMELCNIYFDYLRKSAPKRVLIGTEIFFEIDLGTDIYGDMVKAKGTIDAVFYHGNGVYEIVDYKTSRVLPSLDEFESNMQIAMYDIAFRSKELSGYWFEGIEPEAIMLTMNYLRFDNGILQTEIDEETRKINQMYFIDTFCQMNRKPKEFFVPRLNAMCNYCDCCDICPKYQEVLESDIESLKEFLVTDDKETFENNITDIAVYKSMIKILDNAIVGKSSWCEKYIRKTDEVIEVDGYEYSLGNSSQRYLLPMVTIKILKEHGLWNEKDFINRVPLGKVQAICADYPEVWSELERKALKRTVGNATLRSKKIPPAKLFAEKRQRKTRKGG